jgi:hypothetical protein
MTLGRLQPKISAKVNRFESNRKLHADVEPVGVLHESVSVSVELLDLLHESRKYKPKKLKIVNNRAVIAAIKIQIVSSEFKANSSS